MAHLIVDQSAVTVQRIESSDATGAPFSEEGFVIPVVIPLSEMGTYLDPAFYDPSSSTSPTAAESRKIARVVLDALKKAAEEP
jgi:hypothetical protein